MTIFITLFICILTVAAALVVFKKAQAASAAHKAREQRDRKATIEPSLSFYLKKDADTPLDGSDRQVHDV